MRTKITSFQNPHLKEVQRLRDRRTRRSTGLTILEGGREVSVAQRAKVKFKELFICPEILKQNGTQESIEELTQAGIPVFEISKEIFAKISFGERMEGVLAVCQPSPRKLEDLSRAKNSFWMVVEDIEKPGNLGAILRTCDGAGLDGLLVCGKATDLYNPNVIRSSIGTVFSVEVVQTTNEEVLRFLQDRKVKIFVTSPQAQTLYHQADFKTSCAVVLGSEEKGLSDFWLRHADKKLKIPMKGIADSLNVSTAAAVVLYEALRQKSRV